MKLVIQRVANAKVEVENKIIGQIKQGFLVLFGVNQNDSEINADQLIKKIMGLRIFEDEFGKMNLSLKDVNGELLIVSQFTLYADCKKGNRPSFTNAADPKKANELYQYFIHQCKKEGLAVQTGEFGAKMEVSLTNHGPVTIILEN